MFDYQENPEYELTPAELQQTLIGFLGSTYKEVSQIDNFLVQPNQTLRPIKKGFEDLAQRVIDETVKPHVVKPQPQPQYPIQQNFNYTPQVIQPTHQAIQQIPADHNPDQLEFSFDNSVTAKTIFGKIEDIEKRIKKIDITLSKVLELLQSNDTKNPKQE
jgi:hypothetical protein